MERRSSVEILLIEDDMADAELIQEIISEEADTTIGLKHVSRMSAAIELLGKQEFDAIVTDLSLPDSRGIETFFRIRNYAPKVPIIILTGLNDKEAGIEAVGKGAQDYIFKEQMGTKLLLNRSILHAIERNKLLMELESKMKEIRTLKGLIPMCAWCRKIRDDDGYWKRVEEYISEHTDAEFTHGMCEECGEKAMASLEKAPALKAQALKV
ncbi:MAG TPA: response regulator [Dissulfurispiraceae bacterium]|nr:response regulator [Dissulfurispiraceae bacterium]